MFSCTPYSKSCLETSEALYLICDLGYSGPLCQTCLPGYAKYGGLECVKCLSKQTNYVFIIFVETFTLIVFQYISSKIIYLII